MHTLHPSRILRRTLVQHSTRLRNRHSLHLGRPWRRDIPTGNPLRSPEDRLSMVNPHPRPDMLGGMYIRLSPVEDTAPPKQSRRCIYRFPRLEGYPVLVHHGGSLPR